MKIAILDDYQDVFRTLKCYPRLKGHDVAVYHDSVKEPAKLALLAEDLSFEPYAMALPRNDSALRLEVNKALTQVYLGGEIDTIFAQWLGKLGRPSALLAAMYLLNSIPE